MTPSKDDDSINTPEAELHGACSICGTGGTPLPWPEWMIPNVPYYHHGTGEVFHIVEPCKLQGPGRIWHKGVAARGEMGQLECRTEAMWKMTMFLTPKPAKEAK